MRHCSTSEKCCDNINFAFIAIEILLFPNNESALDLVMIAGLETEESTTLILAINEEIPLARLLDRWWNH